MAYIYMFPVLLKSQTEHLLNLELLGFWTLSTVWKSGIFPFSGEGKETPTLSGHRVSYILEYWAMAKVQKPSDSEC
jgi:hypothetical protein